VIAEILMKLGLALLSGIVLGMNRWIHHKSAGVRTHSLVALGSALVMLLIAGFPGFDAQAVSRVLQGLITGIGFLGAGVIVRNDHSHNIHGLTTAASLWACAILGATFGAGFYEVGACALAAMLLILIIGGPLERLAKGLFSAQSQGDKNNPNS
jgi:putative Mg2+ transporter-C (MgtC) family protein